MMMANKPVENDKRGGRSQPEPIAYFDSSRAKFWTKSASQQWIEFTEGSLRRRLRWELYPNVSVDAKEQGIIQQLMMKIQLEHNVSYAGGIAGYKAGIHEVCGQSILVTDGPRLITPKAGDWSTIKSFLGQLLGDDVGVLFAWLKSALRTLYAGPPFRPGQMLAIAGPAGCGKSLFQNLVTEMMGGRSAKPYRYLVGDTAFNSDLMRSEHLMVEDDASSTDPRSRKMFGTMLKNLIVNEVQSLHRKGRDALSVSPFIRLTITLNDEPENLMVLPPMEDSLRDKIILLRAFRVVFPYDGDNLGARNSYRRQLSAELPAFLSYLRSYRIPSAMRHQRYGMTAYHDPILLKDLMELAPEWKLLSLIDSLGIWEYPETVWEGSASSLEEMLRHKDRTGMIKDLLWFSTACGVFLRAISSGAPQRVSSHRVHGGMRVWKIVKA